MTEIWKSPTIEKLSSKFSKCSVCKSTVGVIHCITCKTHFCHSCKSLKFVVAPNSFSLNKIDERRTRHVRYGHYVCYEC